MRPTLKSAATDLALLLDQAEQKVDLAVDTAKVKAHLAGMDIKEFGEEFIGKLDNMQLRAARLKKDAKGEAAVWLQRVSDACLKLKKEIKH